MENKMVERFWEHPTRYILMLFLWVTVICTVLAIMPKWFNDVCAILLAVDLIILVISVILIIKLENKKKKGQESTQ